MIQQRDTQLSTRKLRVLSSLLFATTLASSALCAFDSAADSVYTSPGFINGVNGGTGWQPWAFTGSGYSLGDSDTNGSLLGPGINTSGRSWAFGGGQTGSANRHLNAALGIGDSMFFDMDINSFGNVYLVAGANNLMTLGQLGNSMFLFDSNGFTTTGLGPTDRGVHVSVTRISATQMKYDLTSLSSGGVYSSVRNGSYALDGIATQWDPSIGTFYINSMGSQVVPEPSSVAAIGMGLVAFLARKRK